MGRQTITEEECQEIRDRRQSGERPTDISDDFDVSSHTITRHANGHCSCGDVNWTKYEDLCEEMQEMRDDGMTFDEIADEVPIEATYSGVRRHVKGICSCDESTG